MREWSWRPELGRWSLGQHGWPESPALVTVGTDYVRPHEAYDFWREIAFNDFAADKAPPETDGGFRASAAGLTWEGADFFHTRSSAVSGQRDKQHIEADGLDGISIGLVLQGSRRASTAHGHYRADAGAFFVYDGRQTSRVEWTEHEAMYLVIRRAELRTALGRDPEGDDLHQSLGRSPVLSLLRDQFELTARHMTKVDAEGRALLLYQARQSALLALASSAEEGSESALFRAAIRLIETRLANPALSADHLARALGISRATLYRAFAASGVGVAETIRDLRLDRLRRALESADARVPVADLALACGILDTANLSRRFRRRFGMSPTDVPRRRHT